MVDVIVLFERLQGCLKNQLDLLDPMITVGEAKSRALRNNRVDDLNEAVKEQESYALEMEMAEQERLLIQESLEKALNIDRDSTLTRLLPFAAEPVRSSLQKLLISLQKKIKTLKDINSLNSILIKKARLVNNRLMQILSSGVPPTYGQKGEIENGLKHISVVNKEA